MSSSQRRKTWADEQGIPTGVLGEWCEDIEICEENRATVYEYRKAGIQILQKILQDNYRRKGVDAVLFGVDNGCEILYAVFVQHGFLRPVGEEEE